MNLQAPNGQTVAFGPQTNQMVVLSVSFDLVAHTYTVVYGPAAGGGPTAQQIVRGTIPAGLQTALENHAQAAIETQNGWTAGTSTVTAP